MQESMTIVVDEVTDDLHDYYQNINEEFDCHGKCVKFFCDMNGISLTFQDVGVAEGNYNGYNWCRAIAVLGYLSIQDSKEYTVIYLPPEVTPHQYEWMQSRRKLFQSKSEKIAIYSYYEKDASIVETHLDMTDETSRIKILYKEIKRKRRKEAINDVSRVRN